MQSTIRLILLLFLFALVLHNYASNRILNLALNTLEEDFAQNTKLLTGELSSELNKLSAAGEISDERIRSLMNKHSAAGLILYDHQGRVQKKFILNLPPSVEEVLDYPRTFRNTEPTRWERYLFRGSEFQSPHGNGFVVLIFDAEKVFRVERSTKLIGYLNWLMIGFVALLGVYLIESTLRPLRVLLQTARTTQSEMALSGRNRNDADFLISTFNGVISRLKEKEQELGKLHLAEKARADDVQQLNEDLFRSITSGLMLIDKANRIRLLNEAGASILFLDAGETTLQPYAPLLQNISPIFKEDVDRCFAQQSNITRPELEIKTNKGEIRYVNAAIMPLRDRQQSFAGVLCIFGDITDFKLLQQHMVLKEKFAILGEMAAGVAHEFRNSLATIAGYLQLLESKMEKDRRSYVLPIQKELELLQKVVNDFLSFAKPVQPRFTFLDLGELVRECVEEAKVTWQKSPIDFSMTGTFPGIAGDESMLRQIFANLIRNAAESINGANRRGAVEISSSTSMNGKTTTVEIRDNGTGIAPQDLPRIFTPFFSTKEKGVGLGLAIVQKLVLQHNGTITTESASDGTVFRLQLPHSPEPHRNDVRHD